MLSAVLPTKKLPNRGASTSETAAQESQVAQFPVSPISSQPIEITLTGIGLANRGANFLPAAAGSKVAQFRGLATLVIGPFKMCYFTISVKSKEK